MRNKLSKLFILLSLITASSSYSQVVTTEQRFQDLFVTAGYGTAFGAAMGAAVLSFQNQPEENLRFVAIGASIGFITGSIFGSYVVFSPVFQNRQASVVSPMLPHKSRFAIGPVLSSTDLSMTGLAGGVSLARF